MSIITTAPAVPSRVFALYSSLLPSSTGERKDSFESWATPPSIRTRGSSDNSGERPTELYSSALREAKKLGLLEEEGDRIRVTDEARGKTGRIAPEIRFKSHLVKVLFDPTRAEAAGQAGFAMALSWFMRRSPLEPMGFGDAPQEKLNKDLGESAALTELTSLNSFQNFIYWARYLGFATIVGTKEARWTLPDPFTAIREALPAVFNGANEMPIDAVMAGLARIYPVLEGGVSRSVIDELSSSPDTETNSRRLSVSTSLALQRLQSSGRISFEAESDAPSLIFDLGTTTSRVSHVSLKAN